MELTHQLTPKLKQLRLSGILDTLEVRTRAAVAGQWSYVEFLERLLEGRSETGGLASGFTLGNSCCTMRGGRFAELNKTQLFARLLATDLVINVSNTFWSTSASFLM